MLKQNGRHFADDISEYIFLNENLCIFFRILLEFVPKGLIDNMPALVQVMAWHQTGAKPLPEPMLTQSTDTHALTKLKSHMVQVAIKQTCR